MNLKKRWIWFVLIFCSFGFFALSVIEQYNLFNCGLSPFGVEGLLICFNIFAGAYFYEKACGWCALGL